MQWRRLAWFFVLAVMLQGSVKAQRLAKDVPLEQTTFGADLGPGDGFMGKPVEIPAGALQVVKDTLHRGAVNCLNGHNISPEMAPASWFAASVIHLDGQDELDLIVQPNLPKIVAHEVPLDDAAGCLLGANVGPFWVIRKNPSGRYGLLLETYALGLTVLDSRTNFYRDIQTVASTATTSTTITYKMAVAQYQIAEKETETH
jgi:hypothetical protein